MWSSSFLACTVDFNKKTPLRLLNQTAEIANIASQAWRKPSRKALIAKFDLGKSIFAVFGSKQTGSKNIARIDRIEASLDLSRRLLGLKTAAPIAKFDGHLGTYTGVLQERLRGPEKSREN